MTETDIRDNPDAKRYEQPIGDQIAVVTYNLSEPNLMITETLVPQALEGQGIASRLARHVIADARARGLLILPVCPSSAHTSRNVPTTRMSFTRPIARSWAFNSPS